MSTSPQKTIKPCVFCKETDFRFLFEPKKNALDDEFSPSSQFLDSERIVECVRCGLVQINPQRSKTDVLASYEKTIEEHYVSESYARSRTFRRVLNQISPLHSGSLLDVGASAGLLVLEAQKRGIEAEGIEPNISMVRWAKNHGNSSVRKGTLNDIKGKDRFGIITFMDVLEHLSDPVDAIRRSKKLLKVKGLVVINIPDFESLSSRILKKHWWFVTSGHLYYFSSKSLRMVLEKHGFEVIYDRPHLQYFSLAHLFRQMGRYNKRVSELLFLFGKRLKFDRVIVPYIAGQRMIIARKK